MCPKASSDGRLFAVKVAITELVPADFKFTVEFFWKYLFKFYEVIRGGDSLLNGDAQRFLLCLEYGNARCNIFWRFKKIWIEARHDGLEEHVAEKEAIIYSLLATHWSVFWKSLSIYLFREINSSTKLISVPIILYHDKSVVNFFL